MGNQWLLDKVRKPVHPLYHRIFATEDEHWFRSREDGKWMIKVINSGTESGGEERELDIDGSTQEGLLFFSGEDLVSKTRTYIADNKLVTEWSGTSKAGQRVHLKNSKEVIEGMYHSTVEDLVHNVQGTRVFRRYPWYKVLNQTEEIITVHMYAIADNIRLAPSMTIQVNPGTSYIEASSSDIEDEQAVFSMADGRDFARVINGFQTVTLRSEDFKHFPYYEIENLTGGDVTMSIYWQSDFVYLVPAKTVVVGPGTSCVTASTKDTIEEQAVFMLPDGRRSDFFCVKPYQSYTLEPGTIT